MLRCLFGNVFSVNFSLHPVPSFEWEEPSSNLRLKISVGSGLGSESVPVTYNKWAGGTQDRTLPRHKPDTRRE